MSHRAVIGVLVALVLGSGQSMQAQSAPVAAAVAVELVSVVPGTAVVDGDWCVGDVTTNPEIVLSARVVGSEGQVTDGKVVWQTCGNHLGGLPKKECQKGGSGRWKVAVISDLSFDSTPSIGTSFRLPILGFRLQYSPERRGLKQATSAPFNLDRTCPS